jgi:hypothetical protein
MVSFIAKEKKKEEKQTPERHASNEIKFRKPPEPSLSAVQNLASEREGIHLHLRFCHIV